MRLVNKKVTRMVVMGPKEREERRNQVMRRRGQKITVIRCILPY
jgi:hypothetical protein